MSEKRVKILKARRRFPQTARDEDRYDGVEVTLILSYLKGEPVVGVRLTEDQALGLAAELLGAVQATRKYGEHEVSR